VPKIIYATGKIVAAALAVFAGSSLALAQDTFQAEAGLSYSRLKTDLSRQNTANAETTYFFDKLPTQPRDYPLDQAQFVERIGSLSAHYSRTSFDIDGVESLSEGSMYGITALFTRPDTPLIAAAGYDSSRSGKSRTAGTFGPGSFSEFESDSRAYQLAVGAYIDKTTALAIDWSSSRTRAKTISNVVGVADFTRNTTFTSIGISGQHLAQLSGGDYLALTVGLSQDTAETQGVPSEKNRVVFLLATYYPTKTLGLNLGVVSDRGDNRFSEGEFYMMGVKMFVTPTFSLSLDFQKSHAKAQTASDFDFLTLKALVRF
jgi:hypothetical protein